LKQIILAVHHDFHCLLLATKLLTAALHSRYVKESESEILEWLDILTPTPQPCTQGLVFCYRIGWFPCTALTLTGKCGFSVNES